MKPKLIKCKLVDVKSKNNGSEFKLENRDNEESYVIKVDESIERIKNRVKDVIEGERDTIYLTRMMTNIDINAKGDSWDINEEDWNYYQFDRKEILNILGV